MRYPVPESPETVALKAEIRKWLPSFRVVLGLTQNGFARAAGIIPSVFTRWLNGKLTSAPCARKAKVALARQLRRLDAAREKAS